MPNLNGLTLTKSIDGKNNNKYQVTRFYRTETGLLIRVQIHWSPFLSETYAACDVLTDHREFTQVYSEPNENFHGKYTLDGSYEKAFRDLADSMARDALDILS
jgi:hypothetical protein